MHGEGRGRGARVVAAVLLALAVVSCGGGGAAAPRGARAVTVPGPEGSQLTARELGAGATSVVLAHGANTTMQSWYDVMEPIAAAGYRVLAFDARGVGGSSGKASGATAARAADIAAVVRYTRAHGARRVVVMGSSLGALAALRAAATGGDAGVVGVSAPVVPGGLEQVHAPALFVASRGDTYPAEATRELAAHFGRRPLIVSGSIHGSELFAEHPEAVRALVAFLREAAPAPG